MYMAYQHSIKTLFQRIYNEYSLSPDTHNTTTVLLIYNRIAFETVNITEN